MAGINPVSGTEGIGDDASFVVTDLVSTWKAAGWSYLSVFGTGFEVEGESVALSGAPNHGAAFVSGPFSLSTLLLFLVTIGGVVAAGYAVSRYTEAADATEAVKAGLTVVPPYLVFATIVAFVMTHSYSEVPAVTSLIGSEGTGVLGLEAGDFIGDENTVLSNVEFGPSTSDAILFAGIVIPAILAAVGGLLTQRRDALETVMAKVIDN